MFDHIGIGVSDLKGSKAFFLQALSPLGVGVIMEFPHAAGLGRAQKPSLWLGTTEGKPLPLHIAFAAETRSQVDEFHRQALTAGGKTTALRGFGLTITPIIMRPSSLDRTVTILRLSVIVRKLPNERLQWTQFSTSELGGNAGNHKATDDVLLRRVFRSGALHLARAASGDIAPAVVFLASEGTGMDHRRDHQSLRRPEPKPRRFCAIDSHQPSPLMPFSVATALCTMDAGTRT